MPKRNDIKRILLLGSGPIVIGQACEFDYSGTQACKALREEGFKVDAISPQAAMYLTIQLDLVGLTTADGKKLSNPKEVNDFILDNAGMAMVPFYGFGASDDSSWFRLSVGTTSMEVIEQCMAKLKTALGELS